MIEKIFEIIIMALFSIILGEIAFIFGEIIYDDHLRKHEIKITQIGIDDIDDWI